MSGRWIGLLLMAVMGAAGCDSAPPAPSPKAKSKKAALTRSATPPKPAPLPSAEPFIIPSSDHYGLPFAWEKANDEPLGQTRNYLAEMLRDNQNHLRHGKAYFEELSNPQKPRATVITCADSRVQSEAWDATPENDDFTIRNIGNQVMTSLGSVQYGVEQLDTPVLLILGHTGCGAVKAVLKHDQILAAPIQKELEGIKVSSQEVSKNQDLAWADAVLANVHHQVRLALGKFGSRVVTGKLTVIGAVYDIRDDLGNGPGRISIVDVNGNAETGRLRAFVAAIQEIQPGVAAEAKSADSELTAPEPEVHPPDSAPAQTAPAASAASAPSASNDNLQALFANFPGLVAKETAPGNP